LRLFVTLDLVINPNLLMGNSVKSIAATSLPELAAVSWQLGNNMHPCSIRDRHRRPWGN